MGECFVKGASLYNWNQAEVSPFTTSPIWVRDFKNSLVHVNTTANDRMNVYIDEPDS